MANSTIAQPSSAVFSTRSLTSILIFETICAPLWGMSILQAAIYFKTYKRDPKTMKFFVISFVILNTLQYADLVYYAYFSFVTCRHPKNYLLSTSDIRSAASGILHYIIIFESQIFYALRIWFIGGRNLYLVACVMFLSVLQLGSGLACAIKALQFNSLLIIYGDFCHISQGISSGTAILADSIITFCLVYFLKGHSFASLSRATKIALDKLVLFSFNVGVITTVFAILTFVTWIALPVDMAVWTIFYFPAGQIYVNSILVSLNSRRTLKENLQRASLPAPPPQTTIVTFLVDDIESPVTETYSLDCKSSGGSETLRSL